MSTGNPTIYSLDELQVHVSDELRAHLSSQYEGLNKNDGDESAASQHLDRILCAMKHAPSTTTCRINLILSNRDMVINGLKEVLVKWKNRNSVPSQDTSGQIDDGDSGHDESNAITVTGHSLLKDMVCVGSSQPLNTVTENYNLFKCRVPPPTSTPEQQDDIFVKWTSRAQKGWPLHNRVVICDRFCGEAVLRGSDIFVRGVLCADSGVTCDEVVAVSCFLASGMPGQCTAIADVLFSHT